MENVIRVYKPRGETPFQTIQRFKKENPHYKNKKIAYAGRLDPLAHGELLLLIEPETKNRDIYQRLNKTYTFKVCFGVATDTYDALGLITKTSKIRVNEKLIREFINKHTKEFSQPYPPFSSARVNGKPLFYWARNHTLKTIRVPTKKVKIFKFQIKSKKHVSKITLKNTIKKNISRVDGDFRQNQILRKWNVFFDKTPCDSFLVITCKVYCSSGLYVRSLAHFMGMYCLVPAFALDIKRDNIELNY